MSNVSGQLGESSSELAAARRAAQEIAAIVDLDVDVELWDGSRIGLRPSTSGDLAIRFAHPGVIPSLVRWPTLDHLIRHYIAGNIDLVGGTLLELGLRIDDPSARDRRKRVGLAPVLKALAPFLLAPGLRVGEGRAYEGDVWGTSRSKGENKDFVQFHYDVGNDFYRLFLDEAMVYSCAYFTDAANSIDQAQQDKLDMICRKLRLKPGDRFLDIGCGWGGLVCHAAEHYGVTAHGVTLSPAQLALAKERVAARGLASRVTLELRDYQDLTGRYDKIASIGMYEHIGLDAIPRYMRTIRGLLADGGLFLNHAISCRVRRARRWRLARPEQRAIAKYIFPGGALDDIGHSVQAMEHAGFEVQDVEAWRWHYALTTEHWLRRLAARRAEAERMAGPETTRIWLAYLAGVSLAFRRGSLRIYQTLASLSARGHPATPLTRADLYQDRGA